MGNYKSIFKICDNEKDISSSKKILMKEWDGDVIFLPKEKKCYIKNSITSALKWCIEYSNECAFAYAAMYITRESSNLDLYFSRIDMLAKIKTSFESFGEVFDFPFLEMNTSNICSSFVFTGKSTRRFVFNTQGDGFFIWDTKTAKFVSHNSYESIDSFIENEIPFIIESLKEAERLIK